jgi:ABC-type transport system involved in cytochrome bd biosynthesis fused ATPase/permease subunit
MGKSTCFHLLEHFYEPQVGSETLIGDLLQTRRRSLVVFRTISPNTHTRQQNLVVPRSWATPVTHVNPTTHVNPWLTQPHDSRQPHDSLLGVRQQAGRVLLNGTSVADIDHLELHQQVSLVSQEPTLLSGSIAENIMYERIF